MSFRNQVFQFLGRILNKGIDELHCVSRGLCTTPRLNTNRFIFCKRKPHLVQHSVASILF